MADAKTAPKKRRSSRKKSGFLKNLFLLLSQTFFGRVFLIALIASLVVGATLLATRNDYDLFFTVLGIELLAVAVVVWIRFLIQK